MDNVISSLRKEFIGESPYSIYTIGFETVEGAHEILVGYKYKQNQQKTYHIVDTQTGIDGNTEDIELFITYLTRYLRKTAVKSGCDLNKLNTEAFLETSIYFNSKNSRTKEMVIKVATISSLYSPIIIRPDGAVKLYPEPLEYKFTSAINKDMLVPVPKYTPGKYRSGYPSNRSSFFQAEMDIDEEFPHHTTDFFSTDDREPTRVVNNNPLPDPDEEIEMLELNKDPFLERQPLQNWLEKKSRVIDEVKAKLKALYSTVEEKYIDEYSNRIIVGDIMQLVSDFRPPTPENEGISSAEGKIYTSTFMVTLKCPK